MDRAPGSAAPIVPDDRRHSHGCVYIRKRLDAPEQEKEEGTAKKKLKKKAKALYLFSLKPPGRINEQNQTITKLRT
jgi:hypothetical protein